MKKSTLIFLILISQVSFSLTTPDFNVSSKQFSCYYQAYEETYQQALSRLQINANNVCKNSKAILVTEIDEQNEYCSVKLTAGYICKNNRITCRPKGYMLKCCDRIANQCWFE